MDDFGNIYDIFPVWQQFVGFQCGEFQFHVEDFFPVWSESDA